MPKEAEIPRKSRPQTQK
eukprot:IDg11888t1